MMNIVKLYISPSKFNSYACASCLKNFYTTNVHLSNTIDQPDAQVEDVSTATVEDVIEPVTEEQRLLEIKRRQKLIYAKSKNKFVDWMRIRVIAGNGGPGSKAFMNSRTHKGGPYGGDGGMGGDIFVTADANITQLSHLKTQYRAGNGTRGLNAWKMGKRGESVTFKVPTGTTLKDWDTGELIADMVDHGQIETLVMGGDPGLGNDHFKAPDFQRPKICGPGEPGEERLLEVELKSIADIGLVGFPNAGKSTLLSAVSRAAPKIADYPFTTLKPNLGVIQYDNYRNITVADIPGLVEDAHLDKGLGHVFLRHVERCGMLIYVLDIAGENPLKQFEILQHELEMYQKDLSGLPSLFVANKLDLLENYNVIKQIEHEVEMPVVGVSAKNGDNIDELKKKILDLQKCDVPCDVPCDEHTSENNWERYDYAGKGKYSGQKSLFSPHSNT